MTAAVQQMSKTLGNAGNLRNVFVLVILPGTSKGKIYEEIKRVGDTDVSKGVVTQCVVRSL